MATGVVPDLMSLELLVSVAKHGSFGRVAKEHGISQPAVSARIGRLERQLGFPVLERSFTGSRLTPEGSVVVDWARGVLDAAAALEAGVLALRGRKTRQVRVAASLTVAEYLVPSWLVTVRARDARISVALSIGNSTRVAERVRSGEASLGFIEGPRIPVGLGSRTIMDDRLCLVVAPGHPWAGREVSPGELAATPVVMREAGSGTRDTLELALQRQGVTPTAALELSSTTAIKSYVVSSNSAAVLSSLAVADEVAYGRLVEVPVPELDLRRRIRVIWPRGHQITGAEAALISVVTRSKSSAPSPATADLRHPPPR